VAQAHAHVQTQVLSVSENDCEREQQQQRQKATTNQSALNAQPLGCAVWLSCRRTLALFVALSVSLAHAICFDLSLWPLWLPYARRCCRQRCRSGGVAYLSSSALHWGFMSVLWLIFVVRRSNCNWALSIGVAVAVALASVKLFVWIIIWIVIRLLQQL